MRGAFGSLALLLLLAGCDDKKPAWGRFTCDCAVLTDMDGASGARVTVCARGAARAVQQAMGCAQSGAPGTIESCRCNPASGGPACTERSCKVHEHR